VNLGEWEVAEHTNRIRRPSRAWTALTIGWARPQKGHSKSPYSTRVAGAFAGPLHVIALAHRRLQAGKTD
jgi:hypothetical protein